MSVNSQGPSKPVIIIGAGVVGLTLAQGCREAGIPFEIYEKLEASSTRSQGWALSLHWSLNSLERTIGPELSARLPEANVDPSISDGEGGFLLLSGATGEARYNVRPKARYVRAGRQKLRNVLTTSLQIEYGKQFESFETTDEGEVVVRFKDGTSTRGGLLVGADGNNSVVRQCLIEKPSLTRLPINLIGATRHFTAEEAAPFRALNPLLFFAVHPETNVFFFYMMQEVHTETAGNISYEATVGLSWIVPESTTPLPKSSPELIAELKNRVSGFAEPMLSIIRGLPSESTTATGLLLGDFAPSPWDSLNGLVTLAGDAAHAMTMYRGEGGNHGILDAALLIDQLKGVYAGYVRQVDGLGVFEKEMWERTRTAVLRSRQAALDGHDWDGIGVTSPLIGMRVPPDTA